MKRINIPKYSGKILSSSVCDDYTRHAVEIPKLTAGLLIFGYDTGGKPFNILTSNDTGKILNGGIFLWDFVLHYIPDFEPSNLTLSA